MADFEANQSYIMGSKPLTATWRDPVSKQNNRLVLTLDKISIEEVQFSGERQGNEKVLSPVGLPKLGNTEFTPPNLGVKVSAVRTLAEPGIKLSLSLTAPFWSPEVEGLSSETWRSPTKGSPAPQRAVQLHKGQSSIHLQLLT